jgi:hypothetical protein
MKRKRSLFAIAWAAGLLCLASTPAWAGPSPAYVSWNYNFTPSQSYVSADAPGTGSVSFTNEPSVQNVINSSDVVVTNLRVSSTASSGSPDTLNTNGAWSATMQLTDNNAGGATDTMTFSGKLGGTFAKNSANVTNTFTGQTTQSWTAPNGDSFTVSMVGYTPPGPPTATNAGSIAAFVSVSPGVTTSGTPEPSTLMLSVLGLGFAGLTSWRKRRRSLAAMLA